MYKNITLKADEAIEFSKSFGEINFAENLQLVLYFCF